MVYIENPLTGYAIKKNGPTAKKLVEQGWDLDSLTTVRKGSRSPGSPGYARTSDMPQTQRRAQGSLHEDYTSLSPGRGRIRPPGAALRTGRRVARRTSRRMDRRDTSHSPRRVARRTSRRSMSPDYSWQPTSPSRRRLQGARERSLTKRGKQIGRLPDRQAWMSFPVVEARPLKQTLADTPASRKAIRRDLEEQIARRQEGRGSLTRGWKAAAPQKGTERRELMQQCGEGCFLQPDTEGFPICPALREGEGCGIDCRGVTSALVRARQWGYENVAEEAEAIRKEKGCPRPKSPRKKKRKNRKKRKR